MYVYTCASVPSYMCRYQTTTCSRQFYPLIVWVLGIWVRLSELVASTLAHRAILLVLTLEWFLTIKSCTEDNFVWLFLRITLTKGKRCLLDVWWWDYGFLKMVQASWHVHTHHSAAGPVFTIPSSLHFLVPPLHLLLSKMLAPDLGMILLPKSDLEHPVFKSTDLRCYVKVSFD